MTKAECVAGVEVLFCKEYPGEVESSYTREEDWAVLTRKPSTILPFPNDWGGNEDRVMVFRGDTQSGWWIHPCYLIPAHTLQVVFTPEGEGDEV